MIENAISLQNIKLQWQQAPVFENFYANFIYQQWTCILGTSGVGKSSLLQIIAGLLKPTLGTVTPALNHQIAYMAQEDLLMPWLSVLDNVLLGYCLRGEKSKNNHNINTKARELLTKVGLEHAIKLKPQQLSGGMRQRVALARTLIEDRPIVLMDEPFGALDTITRLKLQTLAAELLKNHTVIMVTHDPLEALRLAHRIYILQGSPAQLEPALIIPGEPIRDPSNPDVLKLQAELLQLFSQHDKPKRTRLPAA